MASDALREQTKQYERWVLDQALPLWWQAGADHVHGGYVELLSPDGTSPGADRRARVQSRQSYVFAEAARMGWTGPWQEAAPHGIDYLLKTYRKGPGEVSTLINDQGEIINPMTMLYDQAFVLLATASVYRVLPARTDLKREAEALFAEILASRRLPQGGFRENGAKAYISNPHMHLLESLLAWTEVDPAGNWGLWADHIAELALTKFVDAKGGFLREYFAEDWSPAAGDDGRVVEPGHQFEWAWLLLAWGKIRNHPEVLPVARRLFAHGTTGVDPKRDAAIHAMNDAFEPVVATARLWAQTERIKAALALAAWGQDETEKAMLDGEAVKAAKTLWRYLDVPLKGLWLDRFEPDGRFTVEPSPASTFYHIMCCIQCMRQAVA